MNSDLREEAKPLRRAVVAIAGRGRPKRMFGVSPCGFHPECLKTQEVWQASQEELRRMSAQLLTIQEKERQRIATDLHDVLGQMLTMIKLSLEDAAQRISDDGPEQAAGSIRRIAFNVKDAIEEVRRVAKDMRPSMIDDLGILPTLSWFFREFEAASRQTKVVKEISVQESSIPAALKITIFRILQEAVGNIAKHAKADRIEVSLKKTGGVLQFSIADNGRGFDQIELDRDCPLDRGLGLLSMKERAKLSGGRCVIESALGRGTRVDVAWPLDELAAA